MVSDTEEQTTAPAQVSIREQDRKRRLDQQEAAASTLERWYRRNRYYYREQARLFGLHVPPGSRVLHVGCGLGDLLAALEPSHGLGIDLSPRVIELARQRHPHLRFKAMDPQDFQLDETFDYVAISGALADMRDIQGCLECVREICRPQTRLLLSYYSALWGPILRLATAVGLRRPTGPQN